MKKRILSAIVMIGIVIAVMLMGESVFKGAVIILSLLGIYEFMKVRKNQKEIPKIMRLISYLLMFIFVFFGNDFYSSNYTFDYRILIVSFLSFLIPVVLFNDNEKYNVKDAFYLCGGVLFLATAFNSFILVRNIGLANLIYPILVTVMTDTFAYFTGYYIGKNKLCEKISPKKTWEGSIGGSIVATIIGVLFYKYVVDFSINTLLIITITFIFTVIAQIGDLLFSSIKRYFGVKDFSNLIPGHGGILDRLDSIILTIITYILFMNIL